jgi:hypothetical protein
MMVELVEKLPFGVNALGYGLRDKITTPGQGSQVGGGDDSGECFVRPLGGNQFFLNQNIQVQSYFLYGPFQNAFAHIAEYRRVTTEGKIDGDAGAHGTRPDNPHFGDIFQFHGLNQMHLLPFNAECSIIYFYFGHGVK